MYIVCLIILYFAAIVPCHHADDIDEKFTDVYVEVGQPANLFCVWPKANRILSCLWDRFDSNGTKTLSLTYPLEESDEARATYIGNGVNECSIELKNVTQEDLTSWKATYGWKWEEEDQDYRICKVKLVQKVTTQWTTLTIVLLGLGVVLAIISLASVMLFVAHKTGFFEPEQLIAKPEYLEEQPAPPMLFQGNAIRPEY